jgi:hypothetical protein
MKNLLIIICLSILAMRSSAQMTNAESLLEAGNQAYSSANYNEAVSWGQGWSQPVYISISGMPILS